MRLIRWVVGKIILFINALTLPKQVKRNDANQNILDRKTKYLTMYQFEACPFCVKVRRFIRKNNLKINLRNAKSESYRSELVRGGGRYKVPCLKIEKINAKTEWLYESDEIISFLKKILVHKS